MRVSASADATTFPISNQAGRLLASASSWSGCFPEHLGRCHPEDHSAEPARQLNSGDGRATQP